MIFNMMIGFIIKQTSKKNLIQPFTFLDYYIRMNCYYWQQKEIVWIKKKIKDNQSGKWGGSTIFKQGFTIFHKRFKK